MLIKKFTWFYILHLKRELKNKEVLGKRQVRDADGTSSSQAELAAWVNPCDRRKTEYSRCSCECFVCLFCFFNVKIALEELLTVSISYCWSKISTFHRMRGFLYYSEVKSGHLAQMIYVGREQIMWKCQSISRSVCSTA